VSFGFRLSPNGLTFSIPAKLYLPWIHDRVPAAVDPGTFDMRRSSGDEIAAQLPGARTDSTPVEAVEALTDRLGLFWVTSPSEPEVAGLEVVPAEASLGVGQSQAFSATVVGADRQPLDVTVSWSAVPPRVGQVDTRGVFTAAAPGTATVTATFGAQAVSVRVSVAGTTRGPTTFVHQNPSPTGNDLLGGSPLPGGLGVVFAGANGTVLLRTPEGAFSRLASVPGLTLRQVGGSTLANAVAIGRSGSSGVLVHLGGTTPQATVYPSKQVSELDALWFDGVTGMAVGAGNEVAIHRDGGWTTEYHPSFETLLSVIGDGRGGFVVVGELGSLYRWDPARQVWDSLFEGQLSVKLEAAQLLDAATPEAWATGGDRLWHFAGQGWTAEALPAGPARASTTCIGALDGRLFIGAQLGVDPANPPSSLGEVLVRAPMTLADGGSEPKWSAFPMRSIQVPRAVVGQGATGFVVGDLGAVWAWDSGTGSLQEESRGFYGDVADLAVTADGVVAAVNECTSVTCSARRGGIMHETSTGSWEPLGSFPSMEPVIALAARSKDEVVASAGDGVWAWTGSQWSPVTVNGATGAVLDLEWCGAELWATGQNGAVFRGSASALDRLEGAPVSGEVSSLACPSASEIWVAGDGFLSSWTSGTWAAISSPTVIQRRWKAVYAPGQGEALAFGDATYGVSYDTSTMRAVENPGGLSPDLVTGMWGSSIDNLYLVGLSNPPLSLGFALRFDGVSFHVVDLGAHRKATAISGNAPTEVWVGTEGGGVLKGVQPL
jgi:hypothetical protein